MYCPFPYLKVIPARLKNNLALLLLLLVSVTAIAQPSSKKDLENKKKKLQDEISNTSKELDQTRASKKTSLKELNLIANKIHQRENLIGTLRGELNELNGEITTNQRSYDSLQTQLTTLKAEFSRIVNYTYKYKDQYTTISYLLAGHDFNKAYKRVKYLSMYSKYRKAQAIKIQELQKRILSLNDQIVADRSAKINVISQNELQKKELDKDKAQQEKVVKTLQKTEGELLAKLKKKKAEANKLDAAIKNIIEAELKKITKPETTVKTNPGEKKTTTTSKKVEEVSLTPEAKLISTNFESNKGRLPWPVEKGFISSGFGTHAHPVLTGITVNNNGIDISTDKGATARALFDGEVSGVVNIPGAGQAVIIRHGEYLTVYSNLSSATVAKGSKVKAKQSIGTVGYNADDGAIIHLEIWKAKTKLNPQGWIAAR